MPLQAPYEPVELNKVQVAFPADALDYMPEYETCATWNGAESWENQLQRDWMVMGIADIQLIPKRRHWGQDEINRAFKHLGAIQGSYAPKHEHKEAAVSFLLNQWFSHARWKVKGQDDWKGDWPDEFEQEIEEEARANE